MGVQRSCFVGGSGAGGGLGGGATRVFGSAEADRVTHFQTDKRTEEKNKEQNKM